jgi:hypothetical protein
MDPTILQALANLMNDHHAMAVPLTVGIAWSGSESGKLVDLMANEPMGARGGAVTIGAG